jgi:maltooligosyltrehalose trehalohydrolase
MPELSIQAKQLGIFHNRFNKPDKAILFSAASRNTSFPHFQQHVSSPLELPGDVFQRRNRSVVPLPGEGKQSFPVNRVLKLTVPRFGTAPAYEQWDYGAQVSDDGKIRFKIRAQADNAALVVMRHPGKAEAQTLETYNRLNQQKAVNAAILRILEDQQFVREEDYHNGNSVKWPKAVQDKNWDRWGQVGHLKHEIGELDKQLGDLSPEVNRINTSLILETVPLTKDSKQGESIFYKEIASSTNVYANQLHPDGQSARAGALYMVELEQGGSKKLRPDIWSNFQPQDVHGPSEIINLKQFPWSAQGEAFHNTPKDMRLPLVYGFHVGTYTDEGTFNSSVQELDYIKDSGFNYVQINPPNEFPGKRGWGYDGTFYFAPENNYGRPEQYQRLVDESHKRGLGVIQDIVPNHIGPEGAYQGDYNSGLVVKNATPWGDGLNLHTEAGREFVKRLFKFWIDNYHVDGFRIDQLCQLVNENDHRGRQALGQIIEEIHQYRPGLVWIAEDIGKNEYVTQPSSGGGLGMTHQLNFPGMHLLRNDLLEWPKTAKHVEHLRQGLNGTYLKDLGARVNTSDTWDEIGNYGGETLHALIWKKFSTNPQVANAKSRVAIAFPYLQPGPVYNFQGHEFGQKTSPFNYFIDLSDSNALDNPTLKKGPLRDKWYSGQPGHPSDEKRFLDSKLSRVDLNTAEGQAKLKLTKRLNELRSPSPAATASDQRKDLPALWQGGRSIWNAEHSREEELFWVRDEHTQSKILAGHRKGYVEPGKGLDYQDEIFWVANFDGYDYKDKFHVYMPPGQWKEVFNTESAEFGGRGPHWSNGNKSFNEGFQDLTVPGNSILIFQKQKNVPEPAATQQAPAGQAATQ